MALDNELKMAGKMHKQDYLLRELLHSELPHQAIVSCDSAIEKREEDIKILQQIKRALQMRLTDDKK